MSMSTPIPFDEHVQAEFCATCGAALEPSGRFCSQCGSRLQELSPEFQSDPAPNPLPPAEAANLPEGFVFCRGCRHSIHHSAQTCPRCGAVQFAVTQASTGKDRMTAAILALLLGGIGVHKFYLGRPVQGVFYFLFFWLLIPTFIALIEGIVFLSMSDDCFQRKYSC